MIKGNIWSVQTRIYKMHIVHLCVLGIVAGRQHGSPDPNRDTGREDIPPHGEPGLRLLTLLSSAASSSSTLSSSSLWCRDGVGLASSKDRWHHPQQVLNPTHRMVRCPTAGTSFFGAHANVLTRRMLFLTSNCYCFHPVNVSRAWNCFTKHLHNLMSEILHNLSFWGEATKCWML